MNLVLRLPAAFYSQFCKETTMPISPLNSAHYGLLLSAEADKQSEYTLFLCFPEDK